MRKGGNKTLITYLIIAIMISLSMLFSLKYCQKVFDKLEIIGLLMFCSGINQQIFYYISSVFKFVKLVEENLPLTVIRLDYAVISPSLLVWTLYFITKTKVLWFKVFYGLIWIALAIAMQRYEIELGLLVEKNWVLVHQVIKKFVGLALAYIFMTIWHNALKRDRVIA